MLTLAPIPDREALKALALNSVASPQSRRAYNTAIDGFLDWLAGRLITRATILEYRTRLLDGGLSSSTVNLRLCAIRTLAREANAAGHIDPVTAAGIAMVRGVPSRGVRLGRWLTAEQAAALLRAPDVETLRGRRDYAILAVLTGCGLRRAELCRVTLDDIQQRDGRAVFADLQGKGGRVRTVPIPGWVERALGDWIMAAGLGSGVVFRSVGKHDRLRARGLSESGVLWVVGRYAAAAGLRATPHDLRRTCAKLCRLSGGDLEQIQFLLGHASIQTTERYLGGRQALKVAVNDDMGIV
jgi:integrase/recombinase XerD